MNHDDVKIIQENTLYKGFLTLKQFKLQHRLFRGGWSEPMSRELLIRANVVAALPYDPILNQIVLIEQFRIGALADKISPWLIEVVAGLVEEGESVPDVLLRETKEETGLEVLDSWPIHQYWVSPGGSNERVALFLVKVDASKVSEFHGLAEEHEDIKVHRYSIRDALQAMEEGRINNATTLLALQWLALHQQEIQQRWSAVE